MRQGARIAALMLLAPMAAAAQGASPVMDGTAGAQPPVTVSAANMPAANVPAGNAVVLTIDQDALYHGSAWGRRADADLQKKSRDLNAENDRIAAGLEAEDDALTELRKTLSPDDFRVRADAFDRKVQQTRQERDEAARALIEAADRDRSAFFNAALPVFTEVMGERGAVAILERHSVFLAAQTIDITDAMIARLDAELGAGPGPGADAGSPPATGEQGREESTPGTSAPGASAPGTTREQPFTRGSGGAEGPADDGAILPPQP